MSQSVVIVLLLFGAACLALRDQVRKVRRLSPYRSVLLVLGWLSWLAAWYCLGLERGGVIGLFISLAGVGLAGLLVTLMLPYIRGFSRR